MVSGVHDAKTCCEGVKGEGRSEEVAVTEMMGLRGWESGIGLCAGGGEGADVRGGR